VLELARTVQELSPNKVGIVHKEARLGDIRHSVADVTRAKELLDFETEIGLRDGLATFFEP
jgi:UDP-glucose 4-epimerase